MSPLDKLQEAVESPAYLAYSSLIGAAMARLVLGDPSAKQDLLELHQEQAQVVSDILESP